MTYEEEKQYGHMFADKGTYWLDLYDNNKLSKSIVSDVDRVRTYFKDNFCMCTNCTDCKVCTDCKDCVDCIDCIDCINCVGCKKCKYCIDCEAMTNKKDKKGQGR